MDGFESARAAGAGLHARLEAAGVDPATPLAFVEAAARLLDIDLFWLPEGDPSLTGARALFDERTGTICARGAGDPTQRAEDVAHELGHAVVHKRSSRCTDRDLDAGSDGEAYGARERRELEANVFGRELLLPREKARRLFLVEGLGARAIAERCSLRLDVVRRQLLDALVLAPPDAASASDRTPRVPSSHDESQRAAATHRGSPFLLQAGPGTGKTASLLHRLRSLVDEGVDPASIVVLTYSLRAASELGARVAASLRAAGEGIWIGTFHAFGLDLARRHHAELGLPPDLALLDRGEAIELLEDLLPTLPLTHYQNLWEPAVVLRDLVSAIARAKDEVASPARYRALAQAMLDRAASDEAHAAAERALEVALVYERYEHALQQRGALDFGDLVMRPALFLEADDRARGAVQLRHRHVLVDEYQDVNRASVRLLRAVAGEGERLWVVGDAWQTIYRFRGACSSNMASFPRDFRGATTGSLDVGYRSSAEIVATLGELAPRMAASRGMLPLALTASRGSSGVRPSLRCHETLEQEAEGIATSIEELVAEGVPLREQAVLCRFGDRLDEIAKILARRGIPALRVGALFVREEVKDLLAVCSLAVDPFGHGLPRIAAMPRYAIPLADVQAILRALRAHPGGRAPALRKLGAARASCELSVAGAHGLARLVADLDGVPSRASAWELLTTYLLDRTDLFAKLASSARFEDRMRGLALWQLLDFVASVASSRRPIHETLDRVRDIVLLGDDRDLRQLPEGALDVDAVRLMTIHGSKGLEFEAVHVPGLSASSVPSRYWPPRCPPPEGLVEGDPAEDHEHGEECVLYVAASRAKRRLRFYRARRTERGRLRSGSRFLGWMSLEDQAVEHRESSTGATPEEADVEDAPIAVRWPEGWRVTDGQLEAYERCPRRFFYTHVLGLAGARRATPFGRTHDAVYAVIEWAAASEAAPTGAQVEEELARVWRELGPHEHAHAAEYRALARRLVGALVRVGAGVKRGEVPAEGIELAFENGRVVVKPDAVVERTDGTVVLRRVRTGKVRAREPDAAGVALVQLAAREMMAQVEVVHLTDEAVTAVETTPRQLGERRKAIEGLLAAMKAGRFPATAGRVTCAQCPHLFGCGAVSAGGVTIG